MTEERTERNNNIEFDIKPQLRRRRCSKSLADDQLESNQDLLKSENELDKIKPFKTYTIRKFQRSYSQVIKEIEELKPEKPIQSIITKQKSYMEMKANKSQKQRIDDLYNKLSQKYKLQKISKEELFQKAIDPFKELNTFVDLKEKIQEMNIQESKDFKRNLEILKIRDKVSQITDELNKNNGIVDENNIQQLTFKENMLNSIKYNYENSQVKKNRDNFNKNLISVLHNNYQQNNYDENSSDWSKIPASLHKFMSSYLIKQKKFEEMKKREETIKLNIIESQKEKEFRQKLIESQYDMKNHSDQKIPQNQYYENFKRKTDKIIQDSKRQTTREFRKSFNLGNSSIGIINISKQGDRGTLSPIIRSQRSQNILLNEQFFLTENQNTNSQNQFNKIGIPLSNIQSQSNSSQGSLVSSNGVTPRNNQPQQFQQNQPEIKSKFIVFKRNVRSSTMTDSKSVLPNLPITTINPLNESKSNLNSSSKKDSVSFINKPSQSIERISRQVSKIMSNYKEDVSKMNEEKDRRDKERYSNGSIQDISQIKYHLKNNLSENSFIHNSSNINKSQSNMILYRQKSNQVLTLQRNLMKKFMQKISEAEETFQFEKSDINIELNNIENDLIQHMNQMKEKNNFNWEGLTQDELANNVVNHYLFSKLRQRRIRSQQEFLRQSKITKTNY